MKQYKVTEKTARFNAGQRLHLSNDQASSRIHNLVHLRGDLYEVVQPIEFKAGEVVHYDGDLPKHLFSIVETEKAKQKTSGSLPKEGKSDTKNPDHFKTDKATEQFASDNDVDLKLVKGTGKKGVITKKDVVAFLDARAEKNERLAQEEKERSSHDIGHNDETEGDADGSSNEDGVDEMNTAAGTLPTE